MFMRISKAAVSVLMIGGCLVGCHRASSADTPAADHVECAVGDAALADDCSISRSANGDGITISHSDGGFRRFEIRENGVIDVADGAETLTSRQRSDGHLELRISGDRYIVDPDSIAPAKSK